MLLSHQNEDRNLVDRIHLQLFFLVLLLLGPYLVLAQAKPSTDSIKLSKDGRDILKMDSVDFEDKFIESELEKVQFERYSESLKREALRKKLENQQLQNASLQQKLLNEQLKSESVQKTIESDRKIALANAEKEKQLKRVRELEIERLGQQLTIQRRSRNFLLIGLAGLTVFGIFLLVANRKLFMRSKRIQELSAANLQKEMEKQEILSSQNEVLEQQVKERTNELQTTITHLKDTQSQLVRAEKMASLGELTAGIAHEIQNPLNFVNNFTGVSVELMQEMLQEVDRGDLTEARAIAGDIAENLERIQHHGNRAASIVKGMMMHSRAETGVKEMADINSLCQQYTNLALNGFKIKHQDISFIQINYDLSPQAGSLKVASQDLGKVVASMVNNAVYAVSEKYRLAVAAENGSYMPMIEIRTKKENTWIVITVADNGSGIPQRIIEKVFQPFFTTKPTGQGATGLGLSLSYDIITKGHGGLLDVESIEGQGAVFTIKLPA